MNTKINNIILEVNSSCNNNCIYCYIPSEERFSGQTNKNEFFKKKMIEYRKKGVLNVDFAGGEPTVYPHLISLIKFAKKTGFVNLSLISNGRRLSDKSYLTQLIDAGITTVVMSVDGPTQFVAESVTRSPGSFKQSMQAIENLTNMNVQTVVTVVINKFNYKHVASIMEHAVQKGVTTLNVQFLLPYVEDEHVPCQKLPKWVVPDYKDSTQYVKQAIDQFKDVAQIKVHFIPFCYMQGYEEFLMKESNKFDRQVINHSGYEYNIGEHLAQGSTKRDVCTGCKYNLQCMGFYESYKDEFKT